MKVKLLPARVFWLGLLWLVGLGAAFYFVLGRGAKSSVTSQLLRQQRALARAEASNISSFFETFGNSVAVLAQTKSAESRDERTASIMDAFVEQWRESGLLGGVVLTDAEGVVIFNSNISGTHDTGASLADRDYFTWAKSQTEEGGYTVGKAVISRLGASKGEVVVVVASPVLKGGVFAGVMGASIMIKPLTQQYLELMKISESTDTYLIGSDGDVLYNVKDPEVVGSNIFSTYSGENVFIGTVFYDNFRKVLENGEEDGMVAGDRIVAYSPVFLGDRKWLVVMTDPAEKITSDARTAYVRQVSMLIFVYLSTVLFSAVIVREVQFHSHTVAKTEEKEIKKPS